MEGARWALEPADRLRRGPSELARHSIVLNASLKCNRKISTADKTWRSTHLAPSSRLPHDAPPAVVERAQNVEIPHPSGPIQGTTLFRSHISTSWEQQHGLGLLNEKKKKKKKQGTKTNTPAPLDPAGIFGGRGPHGRVIDGASFGFRPPAAVSFQDCKFEGKGCT